MSDLEKLKSLAGYIASSLVDSTSGTMLESDGGGKFAIEAASAANSEFIRAKIRAMEECGLDNDYIEDILVSLGSQYQLIRPIAVRPEIFIFLIMDRTQANLAEARRTLRETEKAIRL